MATVSNNANTKQTEELTDNCLNITNIIIIILLFMILTLCIVLIYCVYANAKRAQKQTLAMANIMKMQQQQIPNVSPTVDTPNTIQTEPVTIYKKDTNPEIEEDPAEFSMNFNRIHRTFSAPVPSPSNIHSQHVNNIAQLHSPLNMMERVHAFSHVGDFSPVVISKHKLAVKSYPMLERVATDPHVYEMEGKSIETFPKNDSKKELETDSDESMYDNTNDKVTLITPMGKPFVIDISEVSVSEKSNNENDCEEKSDKPMLQLTLSAQIADASNQYRALETLLYQKQRESLGDIQMNWTDLIQVDCVKDKHVDDSCN